MIVVDEIAMIAPVNRLSRLVHPRRRHREPEPHHQARFQERGQPRGRADGGQLPEAELESDREHQENHAELRQRLHDVGIGHERDGEVRTNDQAGDQIAQDHGLAQPLEDDRRHRGYDEDDRQRLEKLVGYGWYSRSVCPLSCER
jgi:hypothetical protein